MDQKRHCVDQQDTTPVSPFQPPKKLKSATDDEGGAPRTETAGKQAVKRLSYSDAAAADEGDPPPRWFIRFMKDFDNKWEERFSKRLDELTVKVLEHDDTIVGVTHQLDVLEQEVKKLKKERNELVSKLDDLENRSRRNNLVFHGIAESPKENCYNLITKELLVDFIGLSPNNFKVERCHRTPGSHTTTAPGTNAGPRPRIIHVAFSSYLEKEHVRKACVEKFRANKFKDGKIFVSDDFSKRVLNKRKEKMDTFRRLKEEGKRPFFLYPDRLGFRSKEGKLHILE
ncbi:uncharacterized protein [Diadema antillarum]|uniref:uncharacterized protein n=1 Tax=Diadema antillarum TaxID=105358 RepID=UPI003A896599